MKTFLPLGLCAVLLVGCGGDTRTNARIDEMQVKVDALNQRVKALEGISDRTGKLTFKQLLGVREDQIRIAVESANDGEIQLIVSFEPNPPHRVTVLNFEAGERRR